MLIIFLWRKQSVERGSGDENLAEKLDVGESQLESNKNEANNSTEYDELIKKVDIVLAYLWRVHKVRFI